MSEERKNVLRLEDITMQFGGVVAINNLSMEVNEGEIVALIGCMSPPTARCISTESPSR